MDGFVAGFHLDYTSSQKLTDDWFSLAVHQRYSNGGVRSLLAGKKIRDIDQYASGDIKTKWLKTRNELAKKKQYDEKIEGDLLRDEENDISPIQLIAPKITVAKAIIEDAPLQVSVKAHDPLAWEKRKQDVNFLKYKPVFERQLNDLSKRMGTGDVSLGTTDHTAIPLDEAPLGLDLNNKNDEDVFVKIISVLSVESAKKKALTKLADLRDVNTLKSMFTMDQFRYGVSAHRVFDNKISLFPDVDYIYPGAVEVRPSKYPDFKDRSETFVSYSMSINEMFDKFGNDIGNNENLDNILFGEGGYFNNVESIGINEKDYDSTKVQIVYAEIKSVDWIGIVRRNEKSRFLYLTDDENELAEMGGEKRWAQNTYCAYWLRDTPYFFDKHLLDWSHREAGREVYQNFTVYINKSMERSAVEVSIGEAKKALEADVKIWDAMRSAVNSGKAIDIGMIKKAAKGLRAVSGYDFNTLLDMALKHNKVVFDTSGMDGKSNPMFSKPLELINGGLQLNEITGYAQIIADANSRISRFTGINDQLAGTASEGLIGLQQMRVNSSINAISYANKAITGHLSNIFRSFDSTLTSCIERGGDYLEAVKNLVAEDDASLIKEISDIPFHKMDTKVSNRIDPTTEQKYERGKTLLMQSGVIDPYDEYLIDSVEDIDDRMMLVNMLIKKNRDRIDAIRTEANQQQQVLEQAKGRNRQNEILAKGEVDINKIREQTEGAANTLRLASQLGAGNDQIKANLEAALQKNRNDLQTNKNITTMREKDSIDRQKPFGQ